MSALNWNYILFGGAALGLVVFLPLGVILLVLAVLNWVQGMMKPQIKPQIKYDKPKTSLSGYFEEIDLYEQRTN